MKRTMQVALATAALALVPQLVQAQDTEKSTAVKGGIQVKVWMGKVDGKEAKAGLTVDSAKFVSMGPGMHATTGPAITASPVTPICASSVTRSWAASRSAPRWGWCWRPISA